MHVLAILDLFFHTHTLSGLTQAMAMMMATLMKQQTPSDTQNPIWLPPRRNDLRKSFCSLEISTHWIS